MLVVNLRSDTGLDNLRFAIVKQACVDYEHALKYIRSHTRKPKCKREEVKLLAAQRRKRGCEVFFTGNYFGMLCDLDGELIMNTIRHKYYNRRIRWGWEGV